MAREVVVELELVRHGGASGHPARREATRLARGAPLVWPVLRPA
jgi:hypothetical protein